MTLANLVPNEPNNEADEISMMHRLEITYTQAVILKKMWKGGAHGSNEFPAKRASRQHIYNMRPKLAKHNIHIVNLNFGRYGLPVASREILDQMFLTVDS